MTRWYLDRNPQRGTPSVCLRRLLPEAQFVGAGNVRVSGCSSDPETLDPGHWFIAVGEGQGDGHASVAAAVERGAAGVVVERPVPG